MVSKTASQRALILQGGGALGAFEIGALKTFCNNLFLEDAKSGLRKNKPLFDIVAGASIGAVNAAILVDNVIHNENKDLNSEETWKQAIARLESFYEKISERGGHTHPMWWIDNVFLENELFKSFWAYWENTKSFLQTQSESFFNSPIFPNKATIKEHVANSPLFSSMYFLFPDTWGKPASADLARRYYSYLFSVFWGSPGVLGPAMIQSDMKFLDPLYFTHLFARFNNNPLVDTMKQFCCKLPLQIKTEKQDEENHPRLLIISIDVEDITTPVVFDSFTKKHWDDQDLRRWYSEYGLDSDGNSKFRIEYDGIEMKHIEASMATPIRYDYPKFSVVNLSDGKSEERSFWDGAFLANTPLRQVMRAYRKYWTEKNVDEIPDLEIFIVNLYPSVESGVPLSPDSIQDRQIDITFHDRTKFQVKIDKMRSEYIDLLKELVSIAKNRDAEKVDRLLDQNSSYAGPKDDAFLNKRNALMKNRFKLGRVVYVEREEKSGNTIFAKAFDFSPKTIRQLIKEGESRAQDAFVKCTAEYSQTRDVHHDHG